MGFKGVVPASDYTFNASAKTVTFSANYSTLALSDILYILNAKSGTATVIYDPTDAAKGGTYAGRTLTLAHNTTSMSNSDPLQIIVAEGDVGSAINDLSATLKKYLMAIENPQYVVAGSAQVSVTGGSLTSAGTVIVSSGTCAISDTSNFSGLTVAQATGIPTLSNGFSLIRNLIQ